MTDINYSENSIRYSQALIEYDGNEETVEYNSSITYNDGSFYYSGQANAFPYNSSSTYNDESQLYSGGYTPFPRAIGSGSSSETATGLPVRGRAIVDSGVSSETATGLIIRFRTATGSGDSSQTANGVRVAQRTATGFGSSTQTADWTKSLIFRPPVQDKFPWADYREKTVDHALFGYVRQGNRARNLYLLKNGTFTNVDPLDPATVDKVYLGGHDWFVSPEEKAVLVAAGYTVT